MDDVLQPKNAVQIIRGTSKTLQLSVVDSVNKPVDLTGARVVMTVKSRFEDVNNVFQKTSDFVAQVQITDAKGGIAQIFINPSDTNERDIKHYVFDVWVILASGKRYAVVPPSIFDLQPGVTILA
jgi:hypothetical protein